jgi:hypothetical protein
MTHKIKRRFTVCKIDFSSQSVDKKLIILLLSFCVVFNVFLYCPCNACHNFSVNKMCNKSLSRKIISFLLIDFHYFYFLVQNKVWWLTDGNVWISIGKFNDDWWFFGVGCWERLSESAECIKIAHIGAIRWVFVYISFHDSFHVIPLIFSLLN